MPSKPGVELISGTTEVKTEQKPVQLSTTLTTGLLGVFVSCDSKNTGAIVAVGGSKTTTEAKATLGANKGIIIEKKMAPLWIEVNDLSKVWIDVEKKEDFVCWTAVVA